MEKQKKPSKPLKELQNYYIMYREGFLDGSTYYDASDPIKLWKKIKKRCENHFKHKFSKPKSKGVKHDKSKRSSNGISTKANK